MALTYEQSAALMVDATFRGRIKVSCLKYATYIIDEPSSTSAHQTRTKWAQNTMTAPDVAAALIQPTVVMDPAIQDQGAAVTDVALQTAVETSLNKML
jgi:hypothetical protein